MIIVSVLDFLPKRCFFSINCTFGSHNSRTHVNSLNFSLYSTVWCFLCMTSHAGSILGCQLQSRKVSNGKQRILKSTCSLVLYNEMKQNSHWYFPCPENPKKKFISYLNFIFLFFFIYNLSFIRFTKWAVKLFEQIKIF